MGKLLEIVKAARKRAQDASHVQKDGAGKLALFMEIIGAYHTQVPRDPLPAGKDELIVRCKHCDQSATNPPEGLDWLDLHECVTQRSCSHCNGKGKNNSRTCSVCALEGYCCICHGSGQMGTKEPSFAPRTRKASDPIPIFCVYCGGLQPSRVLYARHLEICAPPSRAVGPQLTDEQLELLKIKWAQQKAFAQALQQDVKNMKFKFGEKVP